jgi:hypothetical protein
VNCKCSDSPAILTSKREMARKGRKGRKGREEREKEEARRKYVF